MSVTQSAPITGQFGALYLIRGASAPFVGSALAPKPAQVRNSRNFAPGTLWSLADRTKKIIDPALGPSQLVVKNNGSVIPGYQYQHLGGGDILFNSAPAVSGGTAEVQSLAVTLAGATTAVLNLTFGGVSNTLAYSTATTAAQVAAALVAIPTIGPGGVTVSGSAGGPFAITFAGAMAAGQQPLISTVGTTYGPGNTTSSAAVTETTAGVAPLTLDAAAVSTSGNYDLVQLSETVDFMMDPQTTMVASNVYGLIAEREFPSTIKTAFTFTANVVDNLLFSLQTTGTLLNIAAFESTKANPPRIWVLSGYMGGNPVDAKMAGMVSGQRKFGCIQLPYYLGENL